MIGIKITGIHRIPESAVQVEEASGLQLLY